MKNFGQVTPVPEAFTLLEEHTLFKMLWRDALIGLAIVSEDGRFIRANSAFCAVLEYSEPELRTMTFSDVTHPADIEADTMLAQITVRGDRNSYTMKKRYLTKTGKIMWAMLHVTAIRQADGAFEFFLSQVVGLPVGEEIPVKKLTPHQNRWLVSAFFRANWQWFAPTMVAAAIIIAEILKRLSV